MAKSKSKKGQLKRYSTPADRYLIITDPWGGTPWQANFFNNVTAWFEIMLKPQYPDVRPSAIYHQSTSRNVVVELPDYIDVTPLLGAHYWKEFLVPPHCFNVADRASYIYEFDYRNHAIPPTQGGWTPGFAAYNKIRDGFDVRDPYPPSRPAPNSSLPIAKQLPLEKILVPGQVPFPDLPPLPPLPPFPDLLDMPGVAPFPGGDGEDRGEGPSSSSRGGYRSRSPEGKHGSGRSIAVGEYNERERGSPSWRERSQTLASIISPLSSQAPPSTTNRDPRRRIQSGQDESVTLYLPHQPPGHLSETAEAFLATIASASTPNITGSSSSMPPPLLPLSPPNASKLKMAKKMDPYEEEEQAMTFLRQSSTIEMTTSTLPSYPWLTNEPSIKTETESKIEVKHEPLNHTHEDEYTPSTELLDAFSSIQNEIEDVKPCIKEGVDLVNEDEDYRPSEELEEAFSSLQDPGVPANDNGYMPSEDLLQALASLPQDMVDFGRRDGHISGVVRVKDELGDDDDFRIPSLPVRLKREPSSPEEASGALYAKRVKLEQ